MIDRLTDQARSRGLNHTSKRLAQVDNNCSSSDLSVEHLALIDLAVGDENAAKKKAVAVQVEIVGADRACGVAVSSGTRVED